MKRISISMIEGLPAALAAAGSDVGHHNSTANHQITPEIVNGCCKIATGG